ncbi:response regulator receiver protein [Arcobacter nitrofigilis DSM 7299]|uniref:Response regulator receiver protein n=1 Tax=Arcobacter nitrofigilis (strain ATCC 33309 / DSM 7299 / CCUG 15893 / LMG 7604 / NCTC 12251 / CI) TaxID=572480 RepID=D5V603_ARCNC|nr:winged helix-turn-helix domain-containing protein [Arcobacter nitrofigilis]ADG93170.1 response regulator receiver protein [Arcobacter nitrofigilis DSM 7299]
MEDLTILLKHYTHAEFKNLSDYELAYIIEKNIPFKVTDIFNLNNGYYYCLATAKLYKNDNEILLTKLENKLLYFLIHNSTKIVSKEELENNVWRNRNKSIYAMRNLIKKIRDKTYYGIIKNISGVGYKIGTKNTEYGFYQ